MKRLYDYVLIDVTSNLLELDMMGILHDIEVDTQDAEKTIFSVLKK